MHVIIRRTTILEEKCFALRLAKTKVQNAVHNCVHKQSIFLHSTERQYHFMFFSYKIQYFRYVQ